MHLGELVKNLGWHYGPFGVEVHDAVGVDHCARPLMSGTSIALIRRPRLVRSPRHTIHGLRPVR